MPESKEELGKRRLRELEGKNVSHYSVMLSTWVQTKMERDKTLITLSSAAIGLLITLITTAGTDNWKELILVVFSFGGFGLCIFTSLTIYDLNAKHIEEELKNISDKTVSLEKFDKRSNGSFLFGAIFFMIFGVSNSIDFILDKEINMSGEKELIENDADSNKFSIDGIGSLKPESSGEKESDNSSDSQKSTDGSNDN